MKKNKVYLEIEKPYFQHINLSRKTTHFIFTLLPYCSPIKSVINNRKVTAIVKVNIFFDNIFIYGWLILNNLKQSYFAKSLRAIGVVIVVCHFDLLRSRTCGTQHKSLSASIWDLFSGLSLLSGCDCCDCWHCYLEFVVWNLFPPIAIAIRVFFL